MKKLFSILVLVMAALFTFTSCEKDNSTTEDTTNNEISEDYVTAQNLMQDAEDEADEQTDIALAMTVTNPPPCPTRTLEFPAGTFPNTLTIDYGTDGCVGPGGRVRKGQIVVTMSAPIAQEDAVRTLTFVDFSIDEAEIEGTKTLTNLGYDDEGNVSINRTIVGGLITFPDDTDIEYDADHTLVQINGADTPNVLFDNVYEITGSATGENRMDVAFTSTVIEPLIKKKFCRWIVAGVNEISNGTNTASLNYGNGNCNKFAHLTLPNGNTIVVEVKRWW